MPFSYASGKDTPEMIVKRRTLIKIKPNQRLDRVQPQFIGITVAPYGVSSFVGYLNLSFDNSLKRLLRSLFQNIFGIAFYPKSKKCNKVCLNSLK